MPLFAFPLALAAAAALPTLAAIYWLHNRFQRRVVSSLMLWADQTPARAGGLRWQRIHTPLLFFLEILALIMLVIAAMGPRVVAPGRTPPLMVVLDDSFSMLAGDGHESSRTRAISGLEAELASDAAQSATLILAGRKPQLLGRLGDRGATAADLLAAWTCQSQNADIDRAIALAGELTNGKCRILVISDRAPSGDIANGRVRWRSFGASRPNLAIVNAARVRNDTPDRCLLEVANFSSLPQKADIDFDMAVGAAEHKATRSSIDLAPHQTRRIVIDLPPSCGVVTAQLPADALALDNTVTLLPTVQRSVRIASSFTDPALDQLMKSVLAVIPEAVTSAKPQLVFSDQPPTATTDPQAWHTQVIIDADAQAYVGPFVIDYAHPLTKGLGLDSIVWGAGNETKIPGATVISAGNIPLLTDDAHLSGRHDLRLRIAPKLSTLQSTPNWPALVWNLVHWRATELPGLSESNIRVGEAATLIVEPGVKNITVNDPQKNSRQLAVSGQRVLIPAELAGVYTVPTAAGAEQFAANLFNAEESDLAAADTGQWGTWIDESALWWEFRGIAWVFLLVALACLAAHGFLIARAGRPDA